MKFSKRLQELRDSRRAAFYVSYRELKKALKLFTGQDVSAVSIQDAVSNFGGTKALEGEHYRPPESRFEDLLQHELDKVNSFSTQTLLETKAALEILGEKLNKLADEMQPEGPMHSCPVEASSSLAANEVMDAQIKNQEDVKQHLERIEAELDEQGREIIFLCSYTRLNFTAFRKIAKKFDKLNQSNSAAYHMCRVMRQPFMTLNLSLLLQRLSANYATLRALKDLHDSPISVGEDSTDHGTIPASLSINDNGSTPEADSSQARGKRGSTRTSKYLVLPDDVVRLQVLLAKHLPLVAIRGCSIDNGRNGTNPVKHRSEIATSKGSDNEASEQAVSAGNSRRMTSLVYFDSPTFDVFTAVHQRARCDNSIDLRHTGHVKCNPVPSSSVSSSFTNNGTTMLIRVREMQAAKSSTSEKHGYFLEFTTPEEPASDKRNYMLNGHEFSAMPLQSTNSVLLQRQQLCNILRGDARSVEDELKNTGYSEESLDALKNAVSCISSNHLKPKARVWFTRTCFRSTDGSVFVSLDEDIRFAAISDWEGIFDVQSAASNDAITPFPWGVMDISLEVPESSLCSKQPGSTEGANSSLALDTIASQPWIREVTVAEEDDEEFQTATASAVESGADAQVRSQGCDTCCKQQQHDRHSHAQRQANSTTGGNGRRATHSSKVDITYLGPGSSIAHDQEATAQEIRTALKRQAPDRVADSTAVDIRGPVAAGILSPHHNRYSGIPLGTLQQPLLPEQESYDHRGLEGNRNTRESCCRRLVSRSCGRFLRFFRFPTARRIVPLSSSQHAAASVRVEPKTFFANERTLLQWLNVAVLLASVSITLLSFGEPAAKAAGLLLSPIAIFFILYSFWIYLRRARALERKEPINYNDKFGPAVLVVSLVLALSANIILSVTNGGGEVLPHEGVSNPGNSSTTSPEQTSSAGATLLQLPEITRQEKRSYTDGGVNATGKPGSNVPQMASRTKDLNSQEDSSEALLLEDASSVTGAHSIATQSRGKWAKYAVRSVDERNEDASLNEA